MPWPSRWRRRGAGWASLLRVPVCPVGRLIRGRAPALDDPAAQRQGLTIVLPGIQGRSFAEYDLAVGLAQGGVPGRITVVDWTSGWFFRAFWHLRDVAMHEAGGEEVANLVAEHRRLYPHAPVYVVGYSGGASVALHGLARLPAGTTATRTLLLAPACSPPIDAAALADRCDHGIDAVCSRLDVPILVGLLTTLGTTDGRHRPGAGWGGFERTDVPAFREHHWRPGWVRRFHYGGHFGAVNRVFAAEALAPLLLSHRASEGAPAPRANNLPARGADAPSLA
ncbi:hypothetical protein [Alienimonas californiensis]|uniref:Alpha/beta hydrolase family protein n=1 Tax=Alienimonas californiensis TaxID=2527989 RepID=A0A517PA79_9PLAN|nr:hypothetical protein [Alienimonas californiensis]QDT16278.1 hypothetical protein CA12_23790 [Alienimonas californiensis]